MILECLLLAIPVSLDCIGIGITYGIKNTRITAIAKLIVFFIFMFVTFIAMIIGKFIIKVFSVKFANILGVILLSCMGIWIIYQSLKSDKRIESLSVKEKKSKRYNFLIKSLGITVEIIKNPINSDLDNSQYIDAKEAFYLGSTISIDAFCAGVGYSVLGISAFFFPLFISICHVLFLSFGAFVGKNLSCRTKIPQNIWSIISGVLIILIGISKLF